MNFGQLLQELNVLIYNWHITNKQDANFFETKMITEGQSLLTRATKFLDDSSSFSFLIIEFDDSDVIEFILTELGFSWLGITSNTISYEQSQLVELPIGFIPTAIDNVQINDNLLSLGLSPDNPTSLTEAINAVIEKINSSQVVIKIFRFDDVAIAVSLTCLVDKKRAMLILNNM